MYLALGERDQSGKGERGHVDLAHEQPLQYHRIEVATGPSHQEPVQLHQQLQVYIIRLRSCPLRLLALTSCFQIDTLNPRPAPQNKRVKNS